MNRMTLFTIVAVLIQFFISYLYLGLAKKLGIWDIPNKRSSHQRPIIRGLGILIPLSVFLYGFYSGDVDYWLILSLIIISTVSFWDDLHALSGKTRFVLQFLSLSILLIGSFNELLAGAWFWIPFVVFFGLGFINAFNFMDGINGITGLYSLTALLSILYISHKENIFDDNLLIVLISSVLVFLFFNLRKNALAFCGDVGSVSMALILLYLLLSLVQESSIKYFLFFSVYGLDTGYTLVYRLKQGHRIFEAHRLHTFQLLANEQGWSHLAVSLMYSLVQLIINLIVIKSGNVFLLSIALLFLLIAQHVFRLRTHRGILIKPINK